MVQERAMFQDASKGAAQANAGKEHVDGLGGRYPQDPEQN
jgi:hypothetical protein